MTSNGTKWDRDEFVKKEPISLENQKAMADYLAAGLRTGRRREDLIQELSERYGKSTRQIERYISKVKPVEEEEEPPQAAQHPSAQLAQPVEVPLADQKELEAHRQDVKHLAQRLRSELHLPATWYSFIEDFGNPGTHPYFDQADARPLYIWKVMKDGHTIILPCPVEADKEVEHLLRGLFGHLATSEFSNVVKSYEARRAKGGQYLNLCRGLLLVVKGDVEKKTGIAAPASIDGKGFGVTWLFLRSICVDAVQRARGFPLMVASEYRHERLTDAIYGLMLGGSMNALALAPLEAELAGYEKMHKRLRKKYGQREISKEIAKLSEEIRKLESSISSELQKFAMTVLLPGHCELCRKAGGLE